MVSVWRMCWLATLAVVLPLAANSLPVRYSQVRIQVSSDMDVRRLASLGLDVHEAGGGHGRSIMLFVNEAEELLLQEQGIPYETVIADWRSAYRSRLEADRTTIESISDESPPRNFQLGTMGGYLTLSAIKKQLESMRERYPNLVGRIDSIGKSIGGRPLWGIRLSWNPQVAENEPRVLYTALHHSREPITVMQMMYYMWYLLENYGTDDEVTSILNSRELYFVPVVNPDGYAENERTDPEGGGMWRKNVRDNGNGSLGVDLNRNYGYQWGADNNGSSQLTQAETYRGKSAFSEPETQAIRDLCKAKRFSVAINYHSFGNLLIYPWGYADVEAPDSLLFRQISDDATAANYYASGRSVQVLYSTNGDSDDWMYGDTLSKPRIIALTAEIGSDDEGFWPLPSRIVPLCQSTLAMNLHMARLGGPLLSVEATEIRHRQGSDTTEITLDFINKGLRAPLPSLSINLEGTKTGIAGPRSYSYSLVSKSQFVVYAVRPPGIPNGTLARIQMTLTYDGGRTVDTIEFRHGVPRQIFFDDADSIRQAWVKESNKSYSSWDTTSLRSWSKRKSYTESVQGDYGSNVSSTFTTKTPLLLDGLAAELRFQAFWDIEPQYDIALVEVSSNSGSTWKPLQGKYTRSASLAKGGKQVAGLWGYDRWSRKWVEEVMDLQDFVGKSVLLRWRFESDPNGERDGMYIDDIRVLTYSSGGFNDLADPLPQTFRLEQNYPNPFNPATGIRYQVSGVGDVRLTVHDLLGREVAILVNEKKEPGNHVVTFDASGLASGMYLYRLTAGTYSAVKRMLYLK